MNATRTYVRHNVNQYEARDGLTAYRRLELLLAEPQNSLLQATSQLYGLVAIILYACITSAYIISHCPPIIPPGTFSTTESCGTAIKMVKDVPGVLPY